MSCTAERDPQAWATFGRQLRAWRRRRGLTQRQLGVLLGYDHSLVSRWESGTREPLGTAVQRLDETLATGGALAGALSEPPPEQPSTGGGSFAQQGLFAPLPENTAATKVPVDADHWPDQLPNVELACPLHGGRRCQVPPLADVLAAIASGPSALPAHQDPELLHGLTALLERLVVHNRTELPVGTAWVESVLRLTVSWSQALQAAGRPFGGPLNLCAHYAVLAGRIRRQCGQNAASMAWFAHGNQWANASGDPVVRATLLGEMSMLARAEHDPASAISYARASYACTPDRGWARTISHYLQARGHALTGDVRECHRHLAQARRGLDQLDERDLAESPCLRGTQGVMHVEATAAAALRDLSVTTGSAASARQAVHAARTCLGHLPEWMRPLRLLLTLRLADSYACTGDIDAARETAAPSLYLAALSSRSVITEELRGLTRRLPN
ncbi:helix-turn-helix domain-containing protein [Streptomyces zagrosensis]|uniref:Transcriptional regulator with XRE-family HTH domain n=1 Tax=Streptomyces zagrosensis TaxID=1042984 RepID=A0A7W9Q8C1_9ACTN|nr:helix-turn-helix transcriptional regulator [Streptomyces zagrosensis]MBB5935483.1 transcriptional regulator with XRE-family HTH domain [Streptomyces zagrosensis]